MNSIQVTIEADEQQQDILISQLSELGAEGFEQTDGTLIAYFSEFDFPSYDVQSILQNIPFHTTVIEEQNWNAVWESNFQPVAVDDFCSIRAEFHEPKEGVEHEIVITPKMSFGTGHHATTYMMVEQMRSIGFQDKKVFDFGTGTGILAILAEKLGAASVIAIDIDTWSVENAKENAEKNSCTKIDIQLSTVIPSSQFDVILANINRNIILEYLPQLKNAMAGNGCILLSGLLQTDREDIVEACRKEGLKLVQHLERHRWISLLFKEM
jgi:ribosomal protein L11 methyltransferase